MSSPEEIAMVVLKALVSTVGVERIVKIVSDLAGGKERTSAILEAQYAANDVAVDVYANEKLGGFKP
jgi:hypothetical protein